MGGAMSSGGARLPVRQRLCEAVVSPGSEYSLHLPPSYPTPTSPQESSECHEEYTVMSANVVGQRRKRRELKSSPCSAAGILLDAGWPDDSPDGEIGDFDAPGTPRTVEPDPLLMAALTIVLLSDWAPLESVKRLQLASASVCGNCREATAFHVGVAPGTPRRLWTETPPPDGYGHGGGGGAGLATVPGVRTGRLTFCESYQGAIDKVRWHALLRRITLGKRFDEPIESIVWPRGLRALEFGYAFDQPIEAAAFPPGLRLLRFGVMFNQDVTDVRWPMGLKHLVFGCRFDRTLQHTRLPRRLETLALGCRWNAPLAAVALPDSLESLRLGYDFNQPLHEVVWPDKLTRLTLGDSFDQPLTPVRLPAGLRSIEIGQAFDQPLEGVRWPEGLERAAFGASMSVCFAMFVVWPSTMAELTVGDIVLKRSAIFFVDHSATHP